VPAPAAARSAQYRRSPTNPAENGGRPASRSPRSNDSFAIEQRFGDHATLIECRLLTGRTHQIRVHLAHAGHPLIGDPVYGARGGRTVASLGPAGAAISAFPRQALHARLLGFIHPATGEKVSFDSPLPAYMVELKLNLELL
jgi:23S rRNA pseudouridine1911/1915/1917 synthase